MNGYEKSTSIIKTNIIPVRRLLGDIRAGANIYTQKESEVAPAHVEHHNYLSSVTCVNALLTPVHAGFHNEDVKGGGGG